MTETPLEVRLKAQIAQDGPISVARLMALALGDPVHGYYATRDPFGIAGDFTTAPEISQMFGELIGLWAADRWMMLGQPDLVHLVELGPGRGTLMADALRAIRKAAPDFAKCIRLELVETSPLMKAKQAQILSAYCPNWHETVFGLPEGPLILIANEFFDALPIRQFERRSGGWHERLVGLEGKNLAFGLANEPVDLKENTDAPEGAVIEWAEDSISLLREMAGRMTQQRGAAVIVDYGHERSGLGDTLQAMRAHAFVHPLTSLGEADLTAHVDFEALARTALQAGAKIDSLTTQANFLENLGLHVMADRLKRNATSSQVKDIDDAVLRLTDRTPTGMGQLFKVLTLSAMPPARP